MNFTMMYGSTTHQVYETYVTSDENGPLQLCLWSFRFALCWRYCRFFRL